MAKPADSRIGRSRGRIIGVIQARMGSTRLPGKPLLRIGDASALEIIVRNLGRSQALDGLVVATSTDAANDAIATESQRLDVAVFRGDEENVVQRLLHAGTAQRAEVIVRITADDVLMDPRVVDYVVATFQCNDADCTTSLTSRSFPNGFVVSAFSATALARLDLLDLTSEEREHVVPGFLQHPEHFTTVSVAAPTEWQGYSLGATLDTPEDLHLIRDLIARFGGAPPPLEELLRLLKSEREWGERTVQSGYYWE